MDFFHFFDVTTLAIVLPQAFLFLLLAVAAAKKGCIPVPKGQRAAWPKLERSKSLQTHRRMASYLPALDTPLKELAIAYVVSLAMSTLVFNTLFASGILAIDTKYIFTWSNLHAVLAALGLSTMAPMPFFMLYQLIIFGREPILDTDRKDMQARYLLGVLACFSFLLLAIPLMQYSLAFFQLNAVPVELGRDCLRLGAAFSCLPASICGFVVAFYGSSRNLIGGTFKTHMQTYRLLKNPGFKVIHVAERSDEELQKLITLALQTKNTRVADAISQHLLNKVLKEQS